MNYIETRFRIFANQEFRLEIQFDRVLSKLNWITAVQMHLQHSILIPMGHAVWSNWMTTPLPEEGMRNRQGGAFRNECRHLKKSTKTSTCNSLLDLLHHSCWFHDLSSAARRHPRSSLVSFTSFHLSLMFCDYFWLLLMSFWIVSLLFHPHDLFPPTLAIRNVPGNSEAASFAARFPWTVVKLLHRVGATRTTGIPRDPVSKDKPWIERS